ncbi:hypothetical protein ARMSODRAFT_1024928 [Armillaria solidipes]|uniref:Uncharacterized protein n=1 Tax=Armillaria solidipes TaxID=1076256 RepID=A0A2H3AUB8_9AGAR|nr:hypothetical protein ARMSODRAFT_1024928 [Armillaria solidipes]
MSESPDRNEVFQKIRFLVLTTSIPLVPFRDLTIGTDSRTKECTFSPTLFGAFLSLKPSLSILPNAVKRPKHGLVLLDLQLMSRVHVRQTCLPATLALSGNDRIMTIAVKRAALGVARWTVNIKINSYSTTVPDCDIYYVDPSKSEYILHSPVVSPDKMAVLLARFNIELFKLLKTDVVPEFLTHCAVYDG